MEVLKDAFTDVEQLRPKSIRPERQGRRPIAPAARSGSIRPLRGITCIPPESIGVLSRILGHVNGGRMQSKIWLLKSANIVKV